MAQSCLQPAAHSCTAQQFLKGQARPYGSGAPGTTVILVYAKTLIPRPNRFPR